MAQNGSLSPKQERVIQELLTPTGNIATIAERLGMGRRTIYNWLELSTFRERLEEERVRLRKDAFNSLRSNLNRAVAQLSALLESESEAIRLKACQTILDYNLKMVELEDFEQRIARLEGSEDYDE